MNLKELMIAQGLSRNELVEQSGLSLNTLEHYLYRHMNISNMKICTMLKVCKGLNLTVEQFLIQSGVVPGGHENE